MRTPPSMLALANPDVGGLGVELLVDVLNALIETAEEASPVTTGSARTSASRSSSWIPAASCSAHG
jgi:hypothetical protein